MFSQLNGSADLAAAVDDVLVATQLFQPHGATGMELLGGNAHLAPQPELPAIGKAGGAVDVDCRTVHRRRKEGGMGLVPGQDSFAVAGGVRGDVADGLLHAVHDLDSQDVVQELGVKIRRACRGAGDDGGCTRVQPQLHRVQPLCRAVRAQPPGQLGQELCRNVTVHQAHLLRVADAGAAGLGVFDDVQRLILLGRSIHEDVADAGTGLDAGDFCVFHTGADEPGPSARDEQIHIAHRRHQGVGRGVGGVLDQADRCFGQAVCPQPLPQSRYNGVGTAPCLPAAPQDAGIAALDGKGGGIAGHVGAALVDDGDHAHGHGGLFDDQPVGALYPAQNFAHRIGQVSHFPDALCHGADALRCQGQPVQHDLRDVPFGGFQIGGIGLQNGLLAGRGAERLCHAQQGGAAHLARGKAQRASCRAGGFQNLLCRHGSALLSARKAGACGSAVCNVVEQLRVGAVGDHHVRALCRYHLGGTELGGHAAGAQCGACPVCQRQHLRGDALYHRDELCVRVGVGIGGVQAVDVAQQHQQVGMDAAGDDGGQRVIVADGGDLVGGNGVVLVDDGQRTQLQQPGQGVLEIQPPSLVLHIHAGEQDLRHIVVVGGEQAVVGVHQLTLAHSGAGLLGGHITGAGGQGQLAHSHADGTGRDEDDLVPCVLQVAQHLDQILCVADVQPPGGVCQCGGAHFDDDAHKLNPFPFPLSCRRRRSPHRSPRRGSRALPARARPEWCCRRGCTPHP